MIPTNKQQILDSIDREYQRQLVEYNNREEFDEETFIDAFNETYHFALSRIKHMYPEWVLKEVDKRILALDLITKEAYEKLAKEERENERIVRKTHQKGLSALKRHAAKLDETILEAFNFEEAAVVSFKQKKNNDVVMRIVDNEEYKKFTFKEAQILEYDETLKFGFKVAIYSFIYPIAVSGSMFSLTNLFSP